VTRRSPHSRHRRPSYSPSRRLGSAGLGEHAHGVARPVLTLVITLALFVGGFLTAAESLSVRTEFPATGRPYDAIVVLGCRVNEGGSASDSLRRRARLAAKLFHQGVAPLIVTTGGVGTHGPSEASVAANILVEEGVPRERIVLEGRSTSTEENAAFARQLIGEARVVVVTDGFHALRARRTFARYFESVGAATTQSSFVHVRRKLAAREVVALLAYAALGKMTLGRPLRATLPSLEGSGSLAAQSWSRTPSVPFEPGSLFCGSGLLMSCWLDEARRRRASPSMISPSSSIRSFS
jgi:uncharacterized SAM-binding protein YcdF (DUF218 family)